MRIKRLRYAGVAEADNRLVIGRDDVEVVALLSTEHTTQTACTAVVEHQVQTFGRSGIFRLVEVSELPTLCAVEQCLDGIDRACERDTG